MKKDNNIPIKQITIAVVVVAFLSISTIILCFVSSRYSAENDGVLDYSTIRDIINQFNDSVSLEDVPDYYAFTLPEVIKSEDKNELTNDICDPKNSDVFKVLLLQACDYSDVELDFDRLSTYVNSKDVSKDVKSNILFYISQNAEIFGYDRTELFKDLASDDTGELYFDAMDDLASLDPDFVKSSLSDTVYGFDGKVTDEYRRSILIYARTLKFSSSNEERKSFNEFCSKNMSFSASNGDIDPTNVFFTALYSLNSKESTVSIITAKALGSDYKTSIIHKRYGHLVQLLMEDFSEENLIIVLDAVNILPVIQLRQPLEELLQDEEYSDFFNIHPEYVEKINTAIAYIDSEGVDGVAQ